MHGNDLAAVQAALGLGELGYVDLAVQRDLAQITARWPFLAEGRLPPAGNQASARPAPGKAPRSLALRGLRGGCGTTALTAALGHALQRLGQRVLMIDMNPDNQLRHHCNLPAASETGWARAAFDRSAWTDCAWRVLPALYLLPYGRLAANEQAQLEQFLQRTPAFWTQRLGALARLFDWVILDLPQRLLGHAHLEGCTLQLCLLDADPACHLRLQEPQALPADSWLLVNRYDPTRALQRDLLLLWQKTLAARLVPQCVHDDEAVREALAHQLPLGVHAPHSAAAEDVLSLATWCLARGNQRRAAPAEAVEAAR